ncbi:MAG: lyase family protein [Thermocladium sp.]
MMYREELLGSTSPDIMRYTSSYADDAEIFRETIVAMIVHVNELERIGVIPPMDASRIRQALREIINEPGVPGNYEDVHEYVEARLIEKLGPVGGWVGLGRSRNDHVAAAIRLRLRKLMLLLGINVARFRKALLDSAARHAEDLMPGSTHKQPAQATTLGHYLLYLDDLSRDFLGLWLSNYCIVNKSPLGAGPLAGTIINLDRAREAGELGFLGVAENTIYATGSRYYMLSAAANVVTYLVELSRFLNNIQMWLMPQLSYINIEKKHLATSSIMPHKRNPATVEVMRARIGEAVGHLMAMYAIIRPLEAGYELDLQEATRHVWSIMRIAMEGISMLTDLIINIQVNEANTSRDLSMFPITAAETAERESIDSSIPFRTVYRAMAEKIRSNNFSGLDPLNSVKSKQSLGAPGALGPSIKARIDETINEEATISTMLKAVMDIEERIIGEVDQKK